MTSRFGKGQVYGTVVADAESGKVTGLLPDREAATLEEWLKARPGAEVICRDRATAYCHGASVGAPLAIQVADCWHLWHNLGEYAEKAVAAHRGRLAGAPEAAASGDGEGPPYAQGTAAPVPEEPDGLRDVLGRERVLVARTLERHGTIHALLGEGRSQREAADILGLDRKTVGRFAAEASPQRLLVKATGRAGKLDPFEPRINQRWNEGVTSAAALHREIAARGRAGSVQAVERYVRQFRGADGRSRAGRNPLQAPPAAPAPKTREVTRWLLTHPDNLDPADQARLDAATAQCPQLDDIARHVRAFAKIMARRQGQAELEGWLTSAEASDLPSSAPSPAASAATSKPSPQASPCPTAPPPWKATSAKSSWSRGRCSAAPDSPSCASASSTTLRDRHHKIRGRARN